MNRIGERLTLPAPMTTLSISAGVALIVFILLQILPALAPQVLEPQQQKVISKAEAAQKALSFAKNKWNLTGMEANNLSVTYATNSKLYGYLAANKLTATYDKKFAKPYPYDTYRVEASDQQDKNTSYYMYLNMQTGEVVSWSKFHIPLQPLKLSKDEMVAAAIGYLKSAGYKSNSLQPFRITGTLEGNTRPNVVFQDSNHKIGESFLHIQLEFDGDQIVSFRPDFPVPQAHLDYVNRQNRYANWMTGIGYAFMTFVLAVLAVVFSAISRRYTSFMRGIFLSGLYTALSIFSTFNILPALQAAGGDIPHDQAALSFGIIVQSVITLVMGAATYFSFVGGDGLWKQLGYNPWPRWQERGYGDYVFKSMWIGYLTAIILLGAQSIIYIVLALIFGTWSTTDATQSTFNMMYPLLFPLMAWVAGIGEEAVYRLFGIVMMKKIVRNTFLACLIPTLIWAFGHTLYPIYPTYSRPIELVILGLMFSFIFLRYGFITAVFAHVIFDSIGMGTSLLFMNEGPVYIFAGFGYMVLPAIVAWIIRIFHRNRKPRDDEKKEPYATTPPEALV